MKKPMVLVAVVASLVSLPRVSPAQAPPPEVEMIEALGVNVKLQWNDFAPSTTYEVWYTDDLVGSVGWQKATFGTYLGPQAWMDNNVLSSSTRMRFYRAQDSSGSLITPPVGFVTVDTFKDKMTMHSMPLMPTVVGSAPSNVLNGPKGCVGHMIGENLINNEEVWKWDAEVQDYQKARLQGKKWKDHSGSDSTMAFEFGEGFWVVRMNTGNLVETITFLGKVPMAPTGSIDVELRKGLTMFNWPYPTTLALNDATCTLTAVAQGGPSPAVADCVYEWDPLAEKYTVAFKVKVEGSPYDGKWFDPVALRESNLQFEPGTARWYLRRGADVTWTCLRPY